MNRKDMYNVTFMDTQNNKIFIITCSMFTFRHMISSASKVEGWARQGT